MAGDPVLELFQTIKLLSFVDEEISGALDHNTP